METPKLDDDINNMEALNSQAALSIYGKLKLMEFKEIKEKLNQPKEK